MGKALAGFFDGLKPSKLDERVLVLVFSEFGRWLKENANGGTDHGAAAPVLIAGRAVRGSLCGPHPNLADLDEAGDPRFGVDFRDLYASLIRALAGCRPDADSGRTELIALPGMSGQPLSRKV